MEPTSDANRTSTAKRSPQDGAAGAESMLWAEWEEREWRHAQAPLWIRIVMRILCGI